MQTHLFARSASVVFEGRENSDTAAQHGSSLGAVKSLGNLDDKATWSAVVCRVAAV